MQSSEVIVRGKDFPAEHHFTIRGERLVARFDQERHGSGTMGDWDVYRKRRGRLERKGWVSVASDGFNSTAAVRAFAKRDLYGSDENPYDAY